MPSSPAPTRHPRGIAYAVLFLIGAGYLTYLGISRDGWWLLTLAPAFGMTLVGVGGLIDDIPKRPRDERGRLLSGTRRELTKSSPPESFGTNHDGPELGRL